MVFLLGPAPQPAPDPPLSFGEVPAGPKVPAHTAEENAIFTKADDGMEEISGHYEPEEGADD